MDELCRHTKKSIYNFREILSHLYFRCLWIFHDYKRTLCKVNTQFMKIVPYKIQIFTKEAHTTTFKDLHCLKEVSFKLSTLHWCSIKASIITTTKRKLKISLPLDIFPSQQRHKTLRHSTRGKNDIAWGEIRGKSSKPQNVNQMCVPPLGVTEQRLEGPLLTCKTMCQHLFSYFLLKMLFQYFYQRKQMYCIMNSPRV